MLPRSLSIEDPAPALYRGIASQLKKDIDSGTWNPGDQIPPEPELADRFQASQGTIRLAVLELVKAGILYRRQGKGTFIAALQLNNSLERFFRYERRSAGKTITPETQVLGIGMVAADEEISKAFQIESGCNVGWLRRMRRYDGEPFLLHDSYFPLDLWDIIQTNCDFAQANLYSQLQGVCRMPIVRADEHLSARIASEQEAELLKIPSASAVVHLERHAYSFLERKVEFRRSVGRGDRFSYHVQL